MTNTPTIVEQIRTLNDQFRTSFDSKLGRVMITKGVQALSPDQREQLLEAVKKFDNFNEGNDPYREHDFGKIDLSEGGSFYWKIEYLDHQKWQDSIGSSHPNDVKQTLRVMTVMCDWEY